MLLLFVTHYLGVTDYTKRSHQMTGGDVRLADK
jgi:hypothetical protein